MRVKYVIPEEPPPRGTLARLRYDRERKMTEAREKIDREFAEGIREIRNRDGLSLRKTGEGIGMSHETVIKLLKAYPEESREET